MDMPDPMEYLLRHRGRDRLMLKDKASNGDVAAEGRLSPGRWPAFRQSNIVISQDHPYRFAKVAHPLRKILDQFVGHPGRRVDQVTFK